MTSTLLPSHACRHKGSRTWAGGICFMSSSHDSSSSAASYVVDAGTESILGSCTASQRCKTLEKGASYLPKFFAECK